MTTHLQTEGGTSHVRLLVLALIAGLLAPLSLLAPSAAQAATSSYLSGNAGIRPCVNTADRDCAQIGTFSRGANVTMVCWIDGSWATGDYRSNRWFLVRRNSDGYEGFAHSSLVKRQTSTPHCNNVRRVKAGLEAMNRVGQIYASSSDAGLFTSWDWTWGRYPYAEWSGDCKKFVSVAYRRAGLALVGGNAWSSFSYYRTNRSFKGGGLPRYGSLVGFRTYMPYGHIAVAVGGNRIATTVGTDGQRKPTAIRSTASFGGYSGWVVP